MKMQIISYDITNDNLRQQVAETLKTYGLVRLQYSVFNGLLPKAKLKDLIRELEDLIKDEKADIMIFELCEACQKNTWTIYTEPRVNEHLDQTNDKERHQIPKTTENTGNSDMSPLKKGKGVIVL